GAEEGHLDAHVGQDARIQLQKRDADLHRSLLTVGGRNDGADFAGDFPIWIGIQDGVDRLAVLNAGDVRLVDVDFDLVRVHVDDRGDAGTSEPTARGNRRDHFADLSVFGD